MASLIWLTIIIFIAGYISKKYNQMFLQKIPKLPPMNIRRSMYKTEIVGSIVGIFFASQSLALFRSKNIKYKASGPITKSVIITPTCSQSVNKLGTACVIEKMLKIAIKRIAIKAIMT